MSYAISSLVKSCSFGGVRFPVLSCRVKGGMRNHEHVYPHSPGAAVEKLGRELYKIEVTPCFQANLIPREFQGIWPGGLSKIREMFDDGKTEELILPTIGKLKAMATSWEQEYKPAISQLGETVTWNFVEDQENARLLAASFTTGKGLAQANEAFKVAGDQLSPKPPLWDKVAQAIDSVLARKGQFELYSSLIESKLQSVISMANTLSDEVSSLSDPRNAFGLEALTELWSQTVKFYQDQQQSGLTFRHKRTPRDMDIGQVSVWLYGDSEMASELLSLNAFVDPYAIPANTDVRFYETK